MKTFTLNSIYFYLTEGCNLACRHCYLDPVPLKKANERAVLSVPLFSKVIKEAKSLGLSSVKLTGGEPLFHPQIEEILKIIKQENLNLAIETNGVLCNLNIAKQIANCELDSKKPFIAVSLDSHQAETHEYIRGIPGCFEKTIQGISNLVNAGLRPQIIMTLMDYNKRDVTGVVRLAEQMNVASIKFNVLQSLGRGEMTNALNILEHISFGYWLEQELAPTTSVKLFSGLPPAFRSLSSMYSNSSYGCARCNILNIIGVLADGTYAMCGLGNKDNKLTFGSAHIDELSNVWFNNNVLNDLRAGLPFKLSGVCGDCLHKAHCLGSCIAQNYHKSFNLFAPFWFCDQAEKAQLFPPTRRN